MSSLIELYEFRTGDEVYRYTSRGNDLLWNDFSWVGTELQRSAISNSSEMAKNDVRIDFPLGHAFGMQFLGYGPDQKTTLTLRRNRITDPSDFFVFWKGIAADCQATDRKVTLIMQSILNAAENSGLIARTQKFCRHVVYHHGCNVNKGSFAEYSLITAIDSRMLEVTCPDVAAFPENYFAGGMITLPGGVLRYITKSVGNKISLWRPAPEIAALLASSDPHTTTLYPGCDGSKDTCHNIFNNMDNNGAFYDIPDVNPYGGSNVF